MDFKKYFNEITIKSLIFTIGLGFLYLLGSYFIKLPFLDEETINLLSKSREHNSSSILQNLEFNSNFSIFLLGLHSFVTSLILIKFISKIKEKFNKKIENQIRIVLILTAILIIIQGLGISFYFESIKYYGETMSYLVPKDLNIILFRVSMVASLLGASFLLIWLIYKFEKNFIIHGYILILILQVFTSYGISNIKEDIKNTKSLFMTSSVIKYQVDENLLKNKILINIFDQNIEKYLLELDEKIKYKRNDSNIEISANEKLINKIKKKFSKKHSLYFMEENQNAIEASVESVEKTTNLPDGITSVKSSYIVQKTGVTIKDYFFKTKSGSLSYETLLKNFIKKLELPSGYKMYYSKVEYPNNSYYRTYILKESLVLSGLLLKEIVSLVDPRDNSPYVSITFNSLGAKLFAELTERLQGHRLAIVIDGIIDSAPVVQERISGGKASITLGAGSYQEQIKKAEELAEILNLSMFTSFITLKE